MWIVDIAVDQYTVTRRIWHIDALSHRYVDYDNYLDSNNRTKCQIVSACTVVEAPNLPPTLIRVHEGVLINDDNQTESLLYLYQAIAHQYTFDFTLAGYVDANGNPEEPKLTVEDHNIPFQFDRSKLFQTIQKPTEEELKTLSKIEITALTPYQLSKSTYL